MTAKGVARRLLRRYGLNGAREKVWARLYHWAMTGHRRDVVTEYLHTDFWQRVGRSL